MAIQAFGPTEATELYLGRHVWINEILEHILWAVIAALLEFPTIYQYGESFY